MIPAPAVQHKGPGHWTRPKRWDGEARLRAFPLVILPVAIWFDARVAWYGTRDDADATDGAGRGRMTVEQALVYLLAAVAAIFLFLGLAQALEGRHGRTRPRATHTASASPQHGTAAVAGRSVGASVAPGIDVAKGPGPELGAASSGNGRVTPRRAAGWVHDGHAGDPVRREAPPNTPAPEPSEMELAGHAGSSVRRETPPDSSAAASAPELPETELALVERAVRLCLAGADDEILEDVAPRLDAEARAQTGLSPHAAAALWCLVGLARSADAAARRAAFAASAVPLASTTPGACPPRLAALAMPVARRLLALVPGDAGQPSDAEGADDRMAVARLAARWLTWHLDAAPDDSEAKALLVGARDVLADAHAEQVSLAIARQDYGVARRLVERAVEATELTELRGGVLLDLLGAEFRREIDRLTAAAIRGDHDEEPAVSGLGRAEALLGAMPDGTIGATHRAAVTQRIWRGHSKLGFRRLRLGQLDAAADTLFHALAMRDIGRRRQRQVRDALVRTLEGLGDQRVAAVASLVAEGKHPAAADEITRLERRIERARGEGVSDEELEVASSKVVRLRRQLASSAE